MTSASIELAARAAVSGQVSGMVRAVRLIDPELPHRLGKAPLSEVRAFPGVEVRLLDVADDGQCGIEGLYVGGSQTPWIGVVRAASSARTAFTALHELGHHLQQTTPELADQLATQADLGKTLEEAACDAFAASILLPEEALAAHLPAGNPNATDLVGLWRATRASRAAVCAAAALRLTSSGHVMVVDEDGRVVFCASHQNYRLARGSDQSASPIVRMWRSGASTTVRVDECRFSYQDGANLGEAFYAQGAAADDYLLVVALAHSAPWKRFSPQPRTTAVIAKWRDCERCLESVDPYGDKCQSCATTRCANCGGCACSDHVRRKVCTGCWTEFPDTYFPKGAARCLDCSE